MERVKAKVKWMKFIFMLNMLKFKTKRRLGKLRSTIQQRQIQRFRQMATFTSQALDKRCELRAHKAFKRFLELSSLITAVNTQVGSFYQGAAFINSAWRRHHACLDRRKKVLSENIWQDESGQLITLFIKKKGAQATPQIKSILRNLAIPD